MLSLVLTSESFSLRGGYQSCFHVRLVPSSLCAVRTAEDCAFIWHACGKLCNTETDSKGCFSTAISGKPLLSDHAAGGARSVQQIHPTGLPLLELPTWLWGARSDLSVCSETLCLLPSANDIARLWCTGNMYMTRCGRYLCRLLNRTQVDHRLAGLFF